MKKYEVIDYISKHKRQARQLCPNAIVVSYERALKAIEHAYTAGVNQGVDGTMAVAEFKKSKEDEQGAENSVRES